MMQVESSYIKENGLAAMPSTLAHDHFRECGTPRQLGVKTLEHCIYVHRKIPRPKPS